MDNKTFLLLGSFLCVANAALAQQLRVDRVAWLQGCWRSTRGETLIEEQWMSPHGGTMLGMGRTVRGRETARCDAP